MPSLRRSSLAIVFVLPVASAPPAKASAQAAPVVPPAEIAGEVEPRETSQRSLRAARVGGGPVLDGLLDDEVWTQADVGGPLVQVMPREGAPASERTQFRVLYDRERLYIGVWCFDSDAAGIVAAEMARDGRLRDDDHVTLVLDTFLDRRNGYFFRVNPNGAREDALITNNSSLNPDWDGLWTARSSRDAHGWYAEVAVPFTTLAFDPSGAAWGFNVARMVQRKREEDRWSGASEHFRIQNVAEAGLLTGLVGLEQGLGLEVAPYGLGRYRHNRARRDEDTTFGGGLDVRYSITPNLTASLSYNTDFAETEVDQRQINLTRFPLFFPEKREFFLQDAGIFEFGGLDSALLPFFSRRIGLSGAGEVVPITVAAKLTGRVEDFNLGLLDALVEEHNGLPSRNAFVGRVSRNVLENSSVGAIVTHGDPNSLDDNLLAGADFTFRDSTWLEGWALAGNAFALGTWTEDLRGDRNLSFGARVAAESDFVLVDTVVYQIDENFNPALGFVPRRDIRTYQGEFLYRPLVESVDWIRRVFVSYFTRSVTDLGNELETALHSLTPVFVQLESGDEVFFNTQLHLDAPTEDFEIHPGVVIPPDEYWFQRFRFGVQSASKRPFECRFSYELGDFYEGTKDSYFLELRVKPFRHLVVGAGYDLNRVRLPEGDFDTRLGFVRAQVSFSPDLVWFNLVQYDDLSDTIGANSRLQWEFRPGSFLYLVVNQSLDRSDGRLQGLETVVTAKVNLVLRF
jgi:hypothetical protein